uniref:Uncharacterized protein n=1 Tax=Hyaloperonospora arabidopsidis (strain Emoy2) TaxID=559515 RepID=M4BQP1_HYAAE
MNLLQGKSNQYLREAILEGSVEKTRRYLTIKIGKADVAALTDSGGFSMLHCACLVGNTEIAMMLLQYGADVLALTDDGYTALDLAIWRGHLQIIELLRSQGCVAPMKEPESLNGKVILHLGRKATVVYFEPSTSIHSRSLRGLYYEDKGEAKLVNLWAGSDYKIVGSNLYYEELRKLDYQYAEIPVTSSEDYDAMLQGALQGAAFFDNDSDSASDDETEEMVEVQVPPGLLGVLLDSKIPECAVVLGFKNLSNGEKGAIELSGNVHPGMCIVSINETDVSTMSLRQVTELLGKLARKEKLIRFADFRAGSPPNHSSADTTSETSNQRSSVTSTTSLQSPVPVSAKVPTLTSSPASFSARFADLAASVLEKKSSTPRTSIISSVDAGTPKAAERTRECGTPATAQGREEYR